MGMNADFFSFQTGVPMSDTIVDGKVLTSDQEKLTGVGFNADGTGFISPLQIYISVSYTHLDVYKRQVFIWCCIKGNERIMAS